MLGCDFNGMCAAQLCPLWVIADKACGVRQFSLPIWLYPFNFGTLLMQASKPINIPVLAASEQQDTMCSSNGYNNEAVVLMVVGDSMEPEFNDGEIIVIEMGAAARDGSFVVGTANDEFIFRQLISDAQDGWMLHALNPAYPDVAIAGLDTLKGVVTQKRNVRSRKSVKYYVE